MVKTKHAFWMALVFAIIVFSAGMFFGYFVEQARSETVEFNLLKSEIDLLDEQIRYDQIFGNSIPCDVLKNNTFAFADRIYEQAVQLERYDSSSKFGRVLKTVHKKYDLMRVMLFNEGMYIQNNCDLSMHTVVYFFSYDEQDINVRAQQTAYSRVLVDLKAKYPDEILLIPIASNLDLSSVQLLMDNYEVSEIPSILIDGKIVIDNIEELDDLENIVFNSNKE